MADIGDIATLGLQIDGSQAQTTATQMGVTLDQLGAKGTAAASQVASAGDKVTQSLVQQYATLQDAQRGWEAEARAMQGASAAQVALQRTQTEAAVVQLRAADALKATGSAADGATFPLGRLRQSFASLAAQATGTSPVIDRIITTLGSFAVGNEWIIGVVAGVAAIGYAWKKLNSDTEEETKRAADSIKKLEDQIKNAQSALGDLSIRDAQDAQKKAQQAFDDANKVRYGATGAKTGVAEDNSEAIAEAKAQLDKANVDLFQAQQNKSQIDATISNEARRTYAENLALLISSNNATAEERQRALALYKSDIAQIAALGKSQTDNVLRSGLIKDSQTLSAALFPQKAVTEANKATDTLTRFRNEFAQFQQEAESFGKDDSIAVQMQAFTNRINQAIVVLQRAKDVNNGPTTAALESIKGQVPGLQAELQGKVQAQFDASIQARITKLQEENAAQTALDATRRQSADAVRAVLIANAGSLAVQEAQAEADKQHLTLSAALTTQLRAQAEAYKASQLAPKESRTVSDAKSLVGGIQNAHELGVGDPTSELQKIDDAYASVIDQQMWLNDTSQDYLDLQEAINILLRERKALIDGMAKSQRELSRYSEEGIQGLSTIINTFASPTHQKSAQEGDLEGIGSNVAGVIASGGGNIGADIGTVTDSFKFLADAFNANSQNIQEQKQIERENTAAIVQMTLKLQGFIPSSVSSESAASNAIRAFESNAGAVAKLTDAQSSTGWSGRHYGDLQTQIDALTPFLQASGLSYDQFIAIAKADGIQLLDKNGRIVAGAVAQFGAAITAAEQSAWTLSQSFTDEMSTAKLGLDAKGGVQTPQAVLTAYYNAFQATSKNAAPQITPGTMSGDNALRQWITSIQKQEAADQASGKAFDYSKYGNFTSIQDFNNALETLLGPLNQLTTSVNGVTAALTNVPTGFKVAYDRYLSTSGQQPSSGSLPVPSELPRYGLPNSSLPPTTTYHIDTVNVTSSATSVDGLTKDIQNQTTRGGTSRSMYVIQKAAVPQ